MKPIKRNLAIKFKVLSATMYKAAKITPSGMELVDSPGGHTYQTVDVLLEMDGQEINLGMFMLTDTEGFRERFTASLSDWLSDSLYWYTKTMEVSEGARMHGAINRRALTKIKQQMNQRINRLGGNERGRPKASTLDKAILAEQKREHIRDAIKILRKRRQEVNQANVAMVLKIVKPEAAENSKSRALRRALERAGLTWDELIQEGQ